MKKLVSSKHLEGINDLTLTAPIKQGFIDAFESVTYETRLRATMKALFRMRATAREHSHIKPFVDTAERIQALLDFRLAILDEVSPPRLLLGATFDRPFEPYMRLIWDPLGPLLDIVFCNCEGYVTATDHGFEEYLAWVRKRAGGQRLLLRGERDDGDRRLLSAAGRAGAIARAWRMRHSPRSAARPVTRCMRRGRCATTRRI